MLTPSNTEAIRRIEEAIGYTFHDKRLLVQVLTRKTYLKIDPEAPDNEVLEFYGDTLMNYHVTNYFMSKYAHMLNDGLFFMRTVEQFTDMRSHYVCNRYLTDRIKAMGLARYLRAQNRDSELRRDGEKAYADIFESLVGAIYLDSYQNDNLIRAFILRQLGIEPKRPPEEIEPFDYNSLAYRIPTETAEPEVTLSFPNGEDGKAAESPAPVESPVAVSEALEESPEEMPDAQPSEAPTPETEPVTEPVTEPAVEPFAAAVVEAFTAAMEEEAPALLPAEPAPVREPSPTAEAEEAPMPMQEALADFCRLHGFDQPTYGETPKNAPNARPVAACTLKYKDAKGKIVKISLNDSGRTLAEATEKAAAKMLKKLAAQTADGGRRKPVSTHEATGTEKAAPVAEPAETASEAPVAEATARPVDETAEVPAEKPVTPTVAEPEAESLPTVTEEAADAEQLVIEVDDAQPPVEAGTETAVETVAETVVETVVETAEEAKEAAPVENTPAEAAAEAAPAEKPKTTRAPRKKKTAAAEGEKPARKTATRKKAASTEATSTEDTPAKEVTVTPAAETVAETFAETVAEAATAPVAETAAEAPVKTTKPRTRKPRAPKTAAAAPAETTEAAVSEGKGAVAEE